MYCNNCGKEITEEVKFCYNCGAKIDVEDYIQTSKKETNKTHYEQALAATIMGGIGVVTSFIPFINIGALVLGILSIVKGAQSLKYGITETKHKNKVVSTIVLSAVGLFLGIETVFTFLAFLLV